MKNTNWSGMIQSAVSLDLSRQLRFREDRKDLLLRVLGLRPGMTVVDVGCGPGTLACKLAGWLGATSLLVGVDRDAAFIAYARSRAADLGLCNVRFIEGDVLALPLAGGSVDACTSHTVIEHVPNRDFLLEQKRVCRAGGRVSVMHVRPDKCLASAPGRAPQISAREEELWRPISRAFEASDEAHDVGKYWPDPAGLPRLFQELGFAAVEVDALALPVVTDDSRNSAEETRVIIESERAEAIERVEMGMRLVTPPLPRAHADELRRLIDERYARRLAMASRGDSLWDYRVSMVLIVSGRA